MMGSATVKRPLLIYAMVFSLALSFALVTFASYGLVKVVRAGHWDAADLTVQTLAGGDSIEAIEHAVTTPAAGRRLHIVTAAKAATGVTLEDARRAVRNPAFGRQRGFASAPIRAPGPEAYLISKIDRGRTLEVARAEIRLLIVEASIAALLCGVLLAVMIARLVLPPLSALRAIVSTTELEDMASATETPNEIAEVAHTFRRTMRKLNEEREEIERQHRELERMQAGMVRASKLASVGRLAAGIAHEIGNPLAAVRGYLSLMERGLEPDEQADVVARSAKQLDRMHETIQKLLTYARKDDGEEDPVPISTREVLNDAIALVGGHPATRAVTIDNQVGAADGADIPDAVGHAGPLGQVLINLLINAAHAMQGVASPRITITRTVSDAVQLKISDCGPGISSDKLEQIFDPFYTTKPPGEGTGLGLAVSRAIMERMGGDLTVESNSDAGACFVVTLQAANA